MEALVWILAVLALLSLVTVGLLSLRRLERKRKQSLAPLLGVYYGRNAKAREDPRDEN